MNEANNFCFVKRSLSCGYIVGQMGSRLCVCSNAKIKYLKLDKLFTFVGTYHYKLWENYGVVITISGNMQGRIWIAK